MSLLRKALKEQKHTIAIESISDVLGQIKSLFSNKPSVSKKKEFKHYSQELETFLTDFKKKVHDFYLNPSWVKEQGVRTGLIKASDFTSTFCVGDHFSDNLIRTAENDAKSITKINQDYLKSEAAWTAALWKLWYKVKNAPLEDKVEFFANFLKENKSPLAAINPDLSSIAGGYYPATKSLSVCEYVVFKQKKSDQGAEELKALNEHQITEYAKTLIKIADALLGIRELQQSFDHVFGELGEEAYNGDHDPDRRTEEIIGLCDTEGLPFMEQEEGVWKLTLHLLDVLTGLESYIHRSLK